MDPYTANIAHTVNKIVQAATMMLIALKVKMAEVKVNTTESPLTTSQNQSKHVILL